MPYPVSAARGHTHPQAAAFVGPLDGISNIVLAYSVRRLLSSYTGPLLRLREDSGDTEQDIGYDANGDLDTAAATAFLSGANGFVVTAYDQSGNGYDITNATAAQQPAYAILDGLPALQSVGTVHGLARSTTPDITQPLTMFDVAEQTTIRGFSTLSDGDNAGRVQFAKDEAANPYVYAGVILPYGSALSLNVPHTLSAVINGASSSFWIDGASPATGDAGSNHRIGVRWMVSPDVGYFWLGYAHEHITLSGSISVADHNTIGASQAAYWGHSWTTVT